jgi:hypothetical protein
MQATKKKWINKVFFRRRQRNFCVVVCLSAVEVERYRFPFCFRREVLVKEKQRMGSGSSVAANQNVQYDSLLEDAPDQLGEEDFKNLCGEEFDRVLYLSLQKPDGYVDRKELLSVASSGEESEVYKLYRCYASDQGTLSQKSFNSLCRDSKLFSKSGGYAISDSSITFEEGSSLSASSLVNYDTFRNNMLPAIASKKGVQLEDLVKKLSHVELPESKAVIPLEVTDHVLSPEAAAAQLMLLTGDDEEETEILRIQWHAAVKLQRIERVRISRRKLKMKHEVSLPLTALLLLTLSLSPATLFSVPLVIVERLRFILRPTHRFCSSSK